MAGFLLTLPWLLVLSTARAGGSGGGRVSLAANDDFLPGGSLSGGRSACCALNHPCFTMALHGSSAAKCVFSNG